MTLSNGSCASTEVHTGAIKPVRSRDLPALVAVGLTGLTVLLYHQVRFHDFVNLDDFEYVVDNPYVRWGLSIQNVYWAFTHAHSSNWHPLTWLSHMVDCQLFGLNPAAHHMTSLLIHTANTLCLFYLLYRMTMALWRSGLVAALFAFHPLHVESVAWVSERKDVLCTLFFLLTILAYLRYVERPNPSRYALVLLFFALGLMAKPMIVTLPFVLILLDFWPLRRSAETIPKLLLEKIPLFLLSAASCTLTYLIHAGGGSILGLPLSLRLENLLFSYATYLGKTFLPVDLSCFYPHAHTSLGFSAFLAGLLLLIVSGAVLFLMRRFPYLATGWLWFLGTLVPVSGLVQTGAQGWADRYTYIPLIGIFIILSWGLNDLLDRIEWTAPRRILLTAVFVTPLLAVSYRQIGYWKDSITLFNREIAVNEQKHVAYTHLGGSYDLMGDRDRAVHYLTEALRIMPEYEEARFFLANALRGKGEFLEAEKQYAALLRKNPNHYKALNNFGFVLMQLGREEEAASCLKRALQIKPDPLTRRNLEHLLQSLDRGKQRSLGVAQE